MRWSDIVGYDIFEDMRALTQQDDAIKRQQRQLNIQKKQNAAQKAKAVAARKQKELADLFNKGNQ